jgi:hypothetical protein
MKKMLIFIAAVALTACGDKFHEKLKADHDRLAAEHK